MKFSMVSLFVFVNICLVSTLSVGAAIHRSCRDINRAALLEFSTQRGAYN